MCQVGGLIWLRGVCHRDHSVVGAECLHASLPSPHQTSDHENSLLEEPDNDCTVDVDATLPPLGVKLTGYKLLFMTTVFCFGTVKTILTYMGQSITPTTLDWVSGTLLAVW